ncbi:Adenylate kinase 9 [Channa argus]|uniref:Adenylate kinase 9 n=1 Tax=Channa argus TaxID=215402 RepID=A0A6G1QK75_CHAAH|nr:Adenylate kinase 9 [Channa argus]
MKVSKSAELYKKRKDSMDEEVEEELHTNKTRFCLQATEKELRKDAIDQMVWTPENLVRNALRRINMYKDTVLRPLENYIVDHNPLYLLELDGNNTPEELNLEDLLRIMSSCEVVAPGFRWRRSRWGRTCPVALKEGNVIPGKPGFCVGFQGKLYILSSHEAYLKFIASPRWYLMPPMPRPPCRVAIIGPPKAGKTTLCKLLAQHYNTLVLDMEELVKPVLMKLEQERLEKIKGEPTQAEEADTDNKVKTGWILDNFPSNFSQMDALKQADILPDMLFCLTNSDGNEVLKRLYKMNKENSDKAIKKTSQEEKSENENNEKVLVSEGLSNLETFVEQTNENSQQFDITSSAHPGISEKEALELPDYCEFGYPDGPEMNDYKLQLEQFMTEWEQMQSALTLTHSVLEIAKKCPEDLLQEMILEMEKPFQYISWEVSSVDQEEEAEDYEALAELERAEEGSSDNDAAEEENEGDITSRRLLGDTHHFCPVALKIHNILWPCTDEIAAKYREKTYYFSNTEARDTFLQNPAQFVAQTEPLKPPALRIFSLGPRGSGKTTHGEWLAQQLGLFHIQFREQLQMLIMAKAKKRVPYQDEVEPSEMAREDLEVLIKEAMGEQEKTEDSSNSMDDMEQKVELTAEEMAIKAYLSDGEPLTPVILNMLLTPYWKQEPYM